MSLSPELIDFFKSLFVVAFGVFAGLLLAFRLAWPKVERFFVKLNVMKRPKAVGKETLRTSAYERLLLLVHRMDVQQVMQRNYSSDLTVEQFQQALIGEIEAEFEHNYTQQLYVSDAAWLAVLQLKKYTVDLIRNTGAKVGSIDAFVEEVLAYSNQKGENVNLQTQVLLKKELNA